MAEAAANRATGGEEGGRRDRGDTPRGEGGIGGSCGRSKLQVWRLPRRPYGRAATDVARSKEACEYVSKWAANLTLDILFEQARVRAEERKSAQSHPVPELEKEDDFNEDAILLRDHDSTRHVSSGGRSPPRGLLTRSDTF